MKRDSADTGLLKKKKCYSETISTLPVDSEVFSAIQLFKMRFRKNTYLCAFDTTFAAFSEFKKSGIFSENPKLWSQTNIFMIYCRLIHILHQVCYFSSIFKNLVFFSKNPTFFTIKLFRMFLKNPTIFLILRQIYYNLVKKNFQTF